jgi:YVTN family beta-propeller protein
MNSRASSLSYTLVLAAALPAQGVDAKRTSVEGDPAPALAAWAEPRPVPAPAARPAAVPNVAFTSTDQLPDGDLPRELAFTPDGRFVLIANAETDNVTFLDVNTRTIVAAVAVGDYPPQVAVAPDGSVAVVPNVFSHTVSIIDVATRAVVATVPVTGQQPYRAVVTSDSRFAVVGVINDAVASTFSVIDLATRTEVRSFPSAPQGVIGGFATPEAGIGGSIFTTFTVSPDARTIVQPARSQSRVVLADLVLGAQTATLPTAALPSAVDVSSDGTVAVVSHEGTARTITRIDLVAGTVAAAFTTAADLFNQVVRITPDRSHAIAALLNAVVFVNLTTGVTAATINTGSVGDIEITFDGRYAFIPNFNAAVIDIPTRTLVRQVTFEAGAEAAASPVDYRVVVLDNRFRENAIVYDANGAGAVVLGRTQSGPPAEGDSTRSLALTPDGRTLVAANNVSENVTIMDALTGNARAYVDTGERVWDLAITPDGRYAVVTNTESSTVSVIDLTTDTRVAQLSVPTRPTELAIAPDGRTAYVTTVAGTDQVWFINLNGGGSSVIGSVPAGQLGTIIYTYNVSSGMALSPSGALLAVCVSFDDQLLLIDTATRSVVARVPVGDFPIRCAFSPDGTRAYVTHSFSNDVRVVAINGGSSAVIATVPGVSFPLTVDVDAAGSFVYAGSFDSQNPRLHVISTASNTTVATVPMASPVRATAYSATDGVLYCALTGNSLARVRAAGTSSAVIERVTLVGSPADLVFSEALRRAYTAEPGARDGVDVVAYGGLFTSYGVGLAGSGGFVPNLAGSGTPSPGETVALVVTQGLGGSPGVFVVGLNRISLPIFGGTLLVDPVFTVTHTLGGSIGVPGAGGISVPIVLPPGSGLIGTRIVFQGVYFDPGAVQGLSMTAGLEMLIL